MKTFYTFFYSVLLILFLTSNLNAQPTNGLVAHYPFNGNANDESGNGNDGIVEGAQLTADRFGNNNSSYSFVGEDDYIELENNVDQTNYFTLSAWVYLNEYNPNPYHLQYGGNTIFARGSLRYSGEWDYIFNVNGNHHLGFVEHPAYCCGNVIESDEEFPLNRWVHVVYVFDNGLAYLYQDGEQIAFRDDFQGGNTHQKDPTVIGILYRSDLGYTSEEWNGYLDDFRIYNYALSEGEITQLYNENGGGSGIDAAIFGEFFDDFDSYDNLNDFKEIWHIVPESEPSGPPMDDSKYSEDMVELVDGIVTLKTYNDGTQASVINSRIETKGYEFFEGTYAAKVRFDYDPINFQDANVQTFYNYYGGGGRKHSECDFEFLPYNTWEPYNSTEPTLHLNTWETNKLEDRASTQYEILESIDWVLLVLQVTEHNNVKYYINNTLIAEHNFNDKDISVYPDRFMNISIANWIDAIDSNGDGKPDLYYLGGLSTIPEERCSEFKIDWVYHSKDLLLTPDQIEQRVITLRGLSLDVYRMPEIKEGKIVDKTPIPGRGTDNILKGGKFPTITGDILVTASLTAIKFDQKPQEYGNLPEGVTELSDFYWRFINNGVIFDNGKISIKTKDLGSLKDNQNIVWLVRYEPLGDWVNLGGIFDKKKFVSEISFDQIFDLAVGEIGNLNKLGVANQKIEYNLVQNFPNPFNPSTVIKYQIPETGFITLKVYDVLGKEVAILVNEKKPAGYYEVEFNATNFPSGIYFYRLQSGSFVETKKMILLK